MHKRRSYYHGKSLPRFRNLPRNLLCIPIDHVLCGLLRGQGTVHIRWGRLNNYKFSKLTRLREPGPQDERETGVKKHCRPSRRHHQDHQVSGQERRVS